MKGIYLNLPDDVYNKVEQIASEKGHLTKTATIRLMIMEYGTTTVTKKPKKQEAKPLKNIEKRECGVCGNPDEPLVSALYENRKVLVCNLCLNDKDISKHISLL